MTHKRGEARPICEFKLLFRHTGMCEAEGIANETSLYFCTLGAGGYILEQVRHN
jgi:hypothetical protein